ncbi:MAG: DUF1826 domain-containing protein, partial [Verrucomicrobiota bacterium]
PGTQWVPEADVRREELICFAASMDEANQRIVPDARAIQNVETGAVLIFKGDLFPGEEGRGLVHRSAPVSGPEQHRFLLCIDTCDYENHLEELRMVEPDAACPKSEPSGAPS